MKPRSSRFSDSSVQQPQIDECVVVVCFFVFTVIHLCLKLSFFKSTTSYAATNSIDTQRRAYTGKYDHIRSEDIGTHGAGWSGGPNVAIVRRMVL